jgi:hypothetical protein
MPGRRSEHRVVVAATGAYVDVEDGNVRAPVGTLDAGARPVSAGAARVDPPRCLIGNFDVERL